jgi:excinuclease UvrABC nuclease subunit
LLAHVPIREGVYGIRSGNSWLYLGHSEDLRRRLLELLQDRSHPLHRYPNLAFHFEVTPAAPDRLRKLMLEFRPICNSIYD